jgi:flavin-dependent dehydrogenase
MINADKGNSAECFDVVIVGGGPAGSTAATLLRKYNPELSVLVLEKEVFPRDHVGESQLPSIGPILDEMGVWDAIEAADFPIKIGASYTWGRNNDRWDFDFFPVELWEDQPRPAAYEGQRRSTAFQVDRAKYDDILLRHAESLGTVVRQATLVRTVHTDGDRITGLTLDNGEVVTGRYYIDGSGSPAILRRALGIGSEAPHALRNIAVWDYWTNADWAVEIGVGATRVQVRSLPWGWIWFIPLGPTRTSIGVICPADHYRDSGKTPEELYREALAMQPDIAGLIKNAEPEGPVQTCKDWSHLADRMVGENWFLCGESAGFADPILAAGMSLAHSSAREAAYTILELERGELERDWLTSRYNSRNRSNIEQHIRFAKFWYSANACFTDLQEHCATIAKDAGLRLSAQQAWRWLSQGGFTTESLGLATAGSFDIASTKQILELFDDRQRSCGWLASGYNDFRLNLRNAEQGHIGNLVDGRIELIPCYRRGDATLPCGGYYGRMVDLLTSSHDAKEIMDTITTSVKATHAPSQRNAEITRYIQALEAMIQGNWVTRKVNRKRPSFTVRNEGQRFIRYSTDTQAAITEAGREDTLRSNID